jgi:hypothetical protein
LNLEAISEVFFFLVFIFFRNVVRFLPIYHLLLSLSHQILLPCEEAITVSGHNLTHTPRYLPPVFPAQLCIFRFLNSQHSNLTVVTNFFFFQSQNYVIYFVNQQIIVRVLIKLQIVFLIKLFIVRVLNQQIPLFFFFFAKSHINKVFFYI